jgi:hypothetical protein
MAPATTVAGRPKHNPQRLSTTERPSKISPGPRTRGNIMPITAEAPNRVPWSRSSRSRGPRSCRMNPDRTVIETRKARL